MNVREIVIAYLKQNGYSGLYLSEDYGDGCGCPIGDLAPCGESAFDCRPGYRVTWENCSARKGEDGCYYGYTTKSECGGCTIGDKPAPPPIPGQIALEVSV